jgi:hypothetical protein
MISQEVFAEHFFNIVSRIMFNTSKKLDDSAIAKYYDLISEELNDEEFTFAANQLFRDSSFLPRPKDFIDLGLQFRKQQQPKLEYRVLTPEEEAELYRKRQEGFNPPPPHVQEMVQAAKREMQARQAAAKRRFAS